MSDDNSAKPLRQHRFKITSKKKPSQSQTKLLGPADVADVVAKPVDGETKTLPQQSVAQAGEGINIHHKRIRSESRPRLLEYPDDTSRGRNQNVGNSSVDPRVEKFTHRRSKSSLDGFYSQNNADRVMQRSVGFNKGAILDAVLQHGFEKTVNFANPRKKLEESIIHVIRGGDTFYDYPASDEFVVTNTKNIGSIKKQEGEEVKKPIPLNRHRSPTQNLPFINNDADAVKNRAMSEPPRSRGKVEDTEIDRESGERVRHDVLPCSFDDRNEEGNDPEVCRPHKKSRGKHKKKSGSSQQPFLFSPQANDLTEESRHSLESESHGAPASIRSPPNSYRIHAKNSSTPKEDGATKQQSDSESHPNFKMRGSQKSFRKWQPNDSTFDEDHGVPDVVSERRPADKSPRDNRNLPCDSSPRESRRLSRSPGETSLTGRSPRRKATSPQEKMSQTSVRDRSQQSPPRMHKKSTTCLKTCERHHASPGDSCRSDHHKSNVICDSATKKELSCLSADKKCDLSMSTANRRTSPNSHGKGKGKGKKKETSPRPYPCMPGFRYRKRCARRLSLNRQNFFGSLAQAVGKELNSIAYRNSLFHSFPGMVGLYRPDIGMDSLFVTPSSGEPSEAEEDIENSIHEKKKKKKDDDDTSRQVSSDEKLTSERDFPKMKEKQSSSKKAGTAKPPSPVKGKRASDSGGGKKFEIKVYEHAIEKKQVRNTATSPHVYEVGHGDYSSSSTEVMTLHADLVKTSNTEVPVQPRLLRKLTGDTLYVPPSEGHFVPEIKDHMSESNLYASQMSQIKGSVSDSRGNSSTPSADSSRQTPKVNETPVPEVRRSTMRVPQREDHVSISFRDRESWSPRELTDIGRKSVSVIQESCAPLTSRGDSRMPAKQDELIFGAPMNLRNRKTPEETVLLTCPITRQDYTVTPPRQDYTVTPSQLISLQSRVSQEHTLSKTTRKVLEECCPPVSEAMKPGSLYQSDFDIGACKAMDKTSEKFLQSGACLQPPRCEVYKEDSRRNLQQRPFQSHLGECCYKETICDYNIEERNVTNEARRKSEGYEDVLRAERKDSDPVERGKAGDTLYFKSSAQENRMAEPVCLRRASDRYIDDICVNVSRDDDGSSSDSMVQNVSFTNKRHSSLSYHDDCADNVSKRASLKESIKEEFRQYPECSEQTTDITSLRVPSNKRHSSLSYHDDCADSVAKRASLNKSIKEEFRQYPECSEQTTDITSLRVALNKRHSSLSYHDDCVDNVAKRTSLKESIKEEFRQYPECIEQNTDITSLRFPSNKRHSSLSYHDDCVDNVAKRTSLKENINDEFRHYPDHSEQTTDIPSSRIPVTNTDITSQRLPFIANKTGDNIINECPILTENLELVRTESFVCSPTGSSSVMSNSTPSKEYDKESCTLYRQDSRSQQGSDKHSRRTSSAKRSPVKSEQRLSSTRHMSQDDCIRPGVEQRRLSSRDQCKSRRASSMIDSTPKQCAIERRTSGKHDDEEDFGYKGNEVRPRDSGHLSDASEDTSTWKQTCSQASVDQTKPCALSSRRSTKRESVREKTSKQMCEDQSSLVSYDSEKQLSELSIVDNECSCTDADATEDDLTISMPSRGSRQFSHGLNHQSSGDEYKEMACEQQRSCKSRNDERYIQLNLKKKSDKHVSDDDATSSSDEETYPNDSMLDYDSGANVAAGDMVQQGQIRKIRGRITFRRAHDKKSPSGAKVLRGSVKTSPNDIHHDSCSTENSEFTETGYIPRKHRSNSISSSKDNMAKYIRDSEYIRERQLRLLEYEQNHTQSCDPGSYSSLVSGNRSPVPAPRSSRKGGYPFGELTSDTADNSESLSYERNLRARQIYKHSYRSHSNTSRLEYKTANIHAKIIDSFVQVITPEQPSAVNDRRSSKSKCDYITQVLRSPDSPYQKPKDELIPAAQKELQGDAATDKTKYLHSKNATPSDYNRNKNSPLSKRSASCQHRQNPFLEIKSEFIPHDHEGETWASEMHRESFKKKLTRQSVETKCKSEDFDADNEKSMISSSSAASVVYRQQGGLFQGCFIPENDATEYMGSSTLLTIAKNKNCSSNTERDRNSSSGGGDFLYSDFAYHCGVIDTLRLLDFDNVSSTPSSKLSLADVVDDNSDVPRKLSFSSGMNAQNLAEIARSIPSVGTDNQEDKAIELVRQNSIRALLFAASMSNSWTPFRLFPSGASTSTKETAKWVEELKAVAPDKKDSDCFVSSSSQEYIRDCDKGSNETVDNTLTFDFEPNEGTKEPTFATKTSRNDHHDNFSPDKSTALAPKSNNAATQRKRSTSPMENTTSDMTVDIRKKRTTPTADVGANTETELVSRKRNKTATRGVKIQVECTRNAAIQTMNWKEKVEKCDKSENTEIQYFVRDIELNTKVIKQSQVEKSKSADDRHSHSASDSKEHSSSKNPRKSTKEHQSFKAVNSADRIVDATSLLTDFSKSKRKCSKKDINHSDTSLRKSHMIYPRERSRSLESITIKRRSCLPLERRRKKQSSRSRERDTSPPRGERDNGQVKPCSSNRSNKYESTHCSLSSSPASPDIVEPKTHSGQKYNKHSWYEDYKPATPTTRSCLKDCETAQTKVRNFERSKNVCTCQRCLKRRYYMKRYINARRKCNGGKKEVIVMKSRRYMGACGDVSTNNKTGNNCKRCLSEDRSLLDNIAIFVVASQTTLTENGLQKLSYPEDLSIKPEFIQKVIEKARFASLNSLDNVHILNIADSDEHSQTTDSPTIEDLGQFTSWKSDTNVPWKSNPDGKAKSQSPSTAIVDTKSTFTISRRKKAFQKDESANVWHAKSCSASKRPRPMCNNINKSCSSPTRLRGKSASVARENKSNSSKWDLQSDNIDSDRSVSNFEVTGTGKHTGHLGHTACKIRRCDDFLRGELSEEESARLKTPNPKNVSSFQMTSTSKWRDTYFDATEFQASTGVFNSSGGSFQSDHVDKTTVWQLPSRGHLAHQLEREKNERNDGCHSQAAVLSSSVDPGDQKAVQMSPLRFIQSLIDGQVKVLLDKAIQNWTSPMLSKPSIFNQESSSVDSPEKYIVTKNEPENSSNDSPEFVVSAVHPMVNSMSKTKLKNLTERQDQCLVKCTASAPYLEVDETKTKGHTEVVMKTLGRNKSGTFMPTSGDNEIKAEKSLPETKSKSSISSKVLSNTDVSSRSVSETEISSTKDHNTSKLQTNRQTACSERSLKKPHGKTTPPQKIKRKRRKAESHAENGKISRRTSKSPSRSRERAVTKSPVADTNMVCAISDPRRSPTAKSKEVKLGKQDVKGEKHKKISNSDTANKEREIPKVKSFSECGVSRIANKLIGEVRTDVCSLGVTTSSTEDIKQRILIGCRHFDKATLERRVMEELIEQKLNGLQMAEDAGASMDADSLAGCEGIESCLLTPIMEESQTTHDKSKNDFDSFVSECKEKLKDIISKSKESANDTLSNPINKSHSLSAPKNVENPCQVKDDTDEENTFELKSSSSKALATSESLHSGCCDLTTNKNTKENLGVPMQLKGPYKSAFLRNEMSSTVFEGSDPFIKENQLISQYSVKKFCTRHQQPSSSDWLAEKIQEDFNFSKSKFSDLHEGRKNFTANVSTYPSAINYRFSLTESHYKSSYMRNTPRNYSDVPVTTSRMYGHRHSSIFSSATTDYCVERAQWFLNEPPRGNRAYMDIAKRNRNESANNGSDSSCSESSGADDVLNADDGDQFTGVAKRTNANMYYPSDKSISEKHTKQVKNNKDGKQRPRKSSYDGTYCQFHEHNSNSYDMLKSNVPNNLVSTLASRNINGSGNMFGRGNGPADENRISNHMSLAEQLGDSDDDYTSASEDMMNYSVKMRNKFIRNEGQEMDDTCNHPDAIGYYASNGQSSQLDVFNGAPKEDLLVNMFSADESHPVVISSYRQKADLAERNGADKKQGCTDTQPCNGHVQQMFKETFSGSRSCFGQGDTSSKKGFTQWYVDENGEKSVPVVQRRAQATSDAGKYECHEEMCQDDADLEDEDDDYDDEDAGVEEDEEEDDEEEEDDVEDDVESDDSNLERELTHAIGDAPNGDCHKKEDNHEIGDLRHYKGEAKTKTDSLEQRAAQNKSYNQSKYKCFDSKTGRINQKNHHHGHRYSSSSRIKHSSGYQKFSLDQIKVPTIEKERVRFACDENGDWAEIGRGSYGCVYLGLLDGIIEVAIKDFYESSSWDLVIHEARMLMFLQDTGITPKFYGLRRRFDVSKQPSEYCIIMEYFGDGRTLFNVMSDKIALTRDAWLDIVGQLVAGLRLIHRKNILINDLKADNILIDLTGGRKIIRYIDVGMATYKQGLTFQLPQDQMSRYNFLAPEVREGARTTTRSDVYSLGYMLEQMCRLADTALGGLKKLVNRCTDKNPSRRPDIDEIVSQVHRFIASKACAPSVASNPQEQFLLTNSV